jgi:ribonuclease P protein component
MLAKAQRIRQGQDFRDIYKNGARIHGRYILLFYRPGTEANSRIGFVVSNKVGHAVVRNRFKRRLRAMLRQMLPELKNPYDIVINARPNITASSSEELRKDLLLALKKAKLC